MVKISRNNIILTRGDSLVTNVTIYDDSGEIYTPGENDVIRFALKKSYDDDDTIILKEIPTDTMVLRLESSDTKKLQQPASYVYDVQLTIDDGSAEGFVTTFISGKFVTKEEVE